VSGMRLLVILAIEVGIIYWMAYQIYQQSHDFRPCRRLRMVMT
jgi:hypothetical protein